MSRRRLMATTLLAFGVVAGAARAQSGDEDDQPTRREVTRVTFHGVHSVSQSDLASTLATQASHCSSIVLRFTICPFYKGTAVYQREYLDHTELRKDVLRIRLYYYQRGWRDTKVDTAVTRSGKGQVAVTFRVAEGPPTTLTQVAIVGADSILQGTQREKQVLLRVREPFSLLALDSSLVRLRDALNNKGYADATVASNPSVDDSTHRASLTITLDPKKRTTVGAITIRGNHKVADQTIRHSLTLAPGDVFKMTDAIASQRALYESNLFRRAAVVVNPPTDTSGPQVDSVKRLIVRVEEAPEHSAQASIGVNTQDFVEVAGRLTYYNFLGDARRLDITGTVGNLLAKQLNQRFIFHNPALARPPLGFSDQSPFFLPNLQASAQFTQPWFHSPNNQLGASVFGHRTSLPGVVVDEGYGTNASFTRLVTQQRSPISLTYQFELTQVQAGQVYFCVDFGVCQDTAIAALSARQKLSPLTLSATIDRTDNPFFHESGWFARADLEHASQFTISDFRYDRVMLEGATYRPMGSGGTLAVHLRTGWVAALGSTADALGGGSELDGIIHPRKRFYAGGSQSVRGYAENQLGPRVLTISPDALRGWNSSKKIYTRCPPELYPDIRSCPLTGYADALALKATDFVPRPVGGSTLLEGSVEFRQRVWGQLYGAVFVDAGVVGKGSVAAATSGYGAITPGFGIRYHSPVGPIRVDLGYAPRQTEALTVLTEQDTLAKVGDAHATPTGHLVPLTRTANGRQVPATFSYQQGYGSFLNRLQLHLSIGEAF